jgi:hypothetical protein
MSNDFPTSLIERSAKRHVTDQCGCQHPLLRAVPCVCALVGSEGLSSYTIEVTDMHISTTLTASPSMSYHSAPALIDQIAVTQSPRRPCGIEQAAR